MTARWVVDEVVPHRDLNITWEPISLLFKNEPDEDSDYYAPVAFTHGLLRVIESVRSAEGDGPIGDLYWELGRRIHHDGDRAFDPADALRAVGLDEKHAAAADDESWDEVIREKMDAGLELVGDNVGTPIIGMPRPHGEEGWQAIFGPVITRVPDHDDALTLWDGTVAVMSVPGFWELKRTRTEKPEFGDRP